MVYRKLIVKVEESKRSEFMKEFDKNLINFIEVLSLFNRIQRENHID